MWSGKHCLIPDFSGIALNFSQFNLMLAVVLLYIVFIVFRYVLVSLISSRPLSWWVFGFCQRLFQHLMRWLCDFLSFILFICWITLTSIHMLSPPWISGMKSTWLWWITFLMCSWIQYFIEYFCLNVHEGDWSVIFFPCCIFVWFGYQGDCSFIGRA